jgi:cytochrome P450
VEKLVANAEILIIGGSETTASLLSGVTYLLLTNPEAYENLKGEVRSTFQSQDDINLISVNKLSYMLACLDEGMRMYPPIANGLPRVCPTGGSTVLGEYIPENVSVFIICLNIEIGHVLTRGVKTFLSIHQWALYRRQEYFSKPNTYHPERWMGSPQFATDRRDVFQPFHLGPRNCLGRKYVAIPGLVINTLTMS